MNPSELRFCVYFKEDDTSPLKPHPPNPQQSALHTTRDSAHIKLNNIIEPDPVSVGSDDFQEFESYQSQQLQKTGVPHSGTSDSIAEGQYKGTPSMTSSGYGSQAVSTLTLSSEDSLSLRSNDDSELTKARRSGIEHTSSGESDGDEAVQIQNVIATSKDDEKSLKSEDSQATLTVEAENESTDSLESQREAELTDLKSVPKKQKENISNDASANTLESTGFETVITNKNKLQTDSLMVSELGKDAEKISMSADSDEEEDDVILPESLKLHISEEDLREDEEKIDDKISDKTAEGPQNDLKDQLTDDEALAVKEASGNKIDEMKMSQKTVIEKDESLPKHNESQKKIAEDRMKDTASSWSEPDSGNSKEKNTEDMKSDKSHIDHNTSRKVFDKLGDVLHTENASVASADTSLGNTNSGRLLSGSDSSSVSSRGVLGSDSIDPYSLEAMDELERLAAEYGEDNSEFLSVDEKFDNSSLSQGNKSLNQSDKHGLDDSLGGYDNALPKNQSTPKGTKEKKQRLVSCIGLSQKEVNEAFHQASNRLSGDFSDTVSGKY